MNEDLELPSWFRMIKNIIWSIGIAVKNLCKQLALGLLSATTYLNVPFFQAKAAMGQELHDYFNQVVAAFFVICLVLSCQDILSKYRNDK